MAQGAQWAEGWGLKQGLRSLWGQDGGSWEKGRNLGRLRIERSHHRHAD
jgi:hypothetical protein